MAKDEDGGSGMSVVKGGLLVLGGLAAAGLALTLLKPALLIAAIGGAGYLGYRLFGATNKKALEGKQQKAIASGGSNADFAARMAELERLEKELDRQIDS